MFRNEQLVLKNTSRKIDYSCRFEAGSFWDKNGFVVEAEILTEEGFRVPLRDSVILPTGSIALLDNVIYINNRGLIPFVNRIGGLAVTVKGFGITLGIEKKQ